MSLKQINNYLRNNLKKPNKMEIRLKIIEMGVCHCRNIIIFKFILSLE